MLLLPSVRAATILCYSGNCSVCPRESLVCSGVSDGCWWVKSAYLPTHGIARLKMNKDDISIMEVILQMRLSEMAVASVSSNTSTQKVEAFNRAVVSTLNKETTCQETLAVDWQHRSTNLTTPCQHL